MHRRQIVVIFSFVLMATLAVKIMYIPKNSIVAQDVNKFGITKITVPDIISVADCMLFLELISTDTEIIRVFCWDNMPLFEAQLTDVNGENCPYSELGKNTIGSELWSASGSVIFINPGESHKWVIPLHQFFDIHPGEWELNICIKPIRGAPDSTFSLFPAVQFKGVRMIIGKSKS